MHRRRFLASALVGAPAFLSAHANRKFRVALIGTGSWGMDILAEAIRSRECSVVGMCDVDPHQLQPATQRVTQLSGDQPRGYQDFRELLANERPDIVIVATPSHWHALQAIAAVQAGAHVYVGGPIGITVGEAQAVVRTARDSDRVVHVVIPRRGVSGETSGRNFLRSGNAGRISFVKAFVHKAVEPGLPTPDCDSPVGMNWDLWCGPGPLRAYNQSLHPGGFDQYLDYSNGMIGDWGMYWMDQVLQVTGERGPRRVTATGGRQLLGDGSDEPDTLAVAFEFDQLTMEWEQRTYFGDSMAEPTEGAYFYGSEGTVHMDGRGGWTFHPHAVSSEAIRHYPLMSQRGSEMFAKFLRNIRAGQSGITDLEASYRATTMSQLGLVSWKAGRAISWDPLSQTIERDAEASKMLRRPYREPWQDPAV